MSNSQYTAVAMVDRIDRYEPPYDRIIEPGLYALEEAMTILLQSEGPDFDAFTTAAGVLEAQSAFWHACSNGHLFFHCVTEQWLPSSRRMTDNRIRDELSFAFAPFYPAFAQKKAMLADVKKATQSQLLREIVVPALTVDEANSLTRMHLIDAIYVHPKIVLSCVEWPKWLFHAPLQEN